MSLNIAKRRQAMVQYYASLDTYPEFKILEPLVQQPEASVEEAIRQLLQLASRTAVSSESASLSPRPWHLFCALFELAKRTPPERHARLIEFVSELQKTTWEDSKTGETLRTEDGQLLWSQLPTLGYTAADEWNAFDVYDDSTTPEERQRWEHLIALLARLSAKADVDYNDPVVGEMDFSFWSLAAFKQAFEPGDRETQTDIAVRTACTWLVYASERLWANIEHGRVFGRYGDDAGTTMTREMWKLWKEGVQRVHDESTDEETRAMADAALIQMAKAAGDG